MKRFKADLHIHTALSPCAETQMSPPAIVEEAIGKGLDMIAVCDHNAAGNTAAVKKAAGNNIAVIAGMEITTVEDIHVLGLFPQEDAACLAANKVGATLPLVKKSSDQPSSQLLMDENARILGTEPKILAASSTLSLKECIALIKKHRGLAVAAHVNRPCFSVLSQLGLFPKNAGFDAIEIFSKARSPPLAKEYVSFGLPIIISSDSHFLVEIGSATTMIEMKKPAFDELALAIKGVAGRRCFHA